MTGGSGRFAKELKKIRSKYKFIYKNKKELNILSVKSIENNLNKYKPDCLLHLAALSRPMSLHDKNIAKSIDVNIIGTANLVKICSKKNIKIIFFSTSYVYPGIKMYKNSLIIRACMTEKPFIHKFAFDNVKSNFIFHDEFAKIFVNLINKKGIINVGGKSQSIYNFVKQNNKEVKGIKSKGQLPLKMNMNLDKLKKIIPV